MFDLKRTAFPSMIPVGFSPNNIEIKRKSRLKGLWQPKKFLAELLGTFILCVVTKGAVVTLAIAVENGDLTASAAHFPACLASGLAVMMGILVTGKASGAQTNPAVSLTMAFGGKLPWIQLPAYFVAQFIGAGLGAAFILLNFRESIGSIGPECVASFPDFSDNILHQIFDQFLATFLLLSSIQAVDDQGHTPAGLLVGLSVAAIGLATGRNAGASMNPALDFSPRVVATLWDSLEQGEPDWEPFTRGGYFWIVPLTVPYAGGLFSLLVYKYFIKRYEMLEPEDELANIELPTVTSGNDDGCQPSCPGKQDMMGQAHFNMAFVPDIQKSKHFDGKLCHRVATIY